LVPSASPPTCTSSLESVPELPRSPLVTALLALAEQLSPDDRRTLARLLLADPGVKEDANKC
ncbi:MAG: hypothetical protein L0241_29420, partial [Planctomycetia bacterium]|nr:hypothetical protein [Planctomycetia bacterium]